MDSWLIGIPVSFSFTAAVRLTGTSLPLHPQRSREVVAEFNGEMITDEVYVLVLREADERPRLV